MHFNTNPLKKVSAVCPHTSNKNTAVNVMYMTAHSNCKMNYCVLVMKVWSIYMFGYIFFGVYKNHTNSSSWCCREVFSWSEELSLCWRSSTSLCLASSSLLSSLTCENKKTQAVLAVKHRTSKRKRNYQWRKFPWFVLSDIVLHHWICEPWKNSSLQLNVIAF